MDLIALRSLTFSLGVHIHLTEYRITAESLTRYITWGCVIDVNIAKQPFFSSSDYIEIISATALVFIFAI